MEVMDSRREGGRTEEEEYCENERNEGKKEEQAMRMYVEGVNGFKDEEEEKRNIVSDRNEGKKEEQAMRRYVDGGDGFKEGGRTEEEYCENEGMKGRRKKGQ